MPDNDIIPIDQILPSKLPVISLIGRPIFPGIFTPIMIANPPDIHIVEQAMAADGMVGLVLAREEDSAEGPNLFSVGTAAKVVKRINLPDGGINIFISTLKRFKIKKFLTKEAPLFVAASYLDDTNDDTDEIKALTRALLGEMKQISENNPLFSEEMRLNMINIDHPGKIADFIASILNIDKKEQQRVLETTDVHQRMELVLIFIKKEQELLRIQKRVQAEINEKIEKSQREYFLKEELKAIKQELGLPSDAKSSEYQKFKGKIESFGFEGEIKEQVEQELEKFNLMDPSSSEYIVTRNWLDLISSLPWKKELSSDFDMKKAQAILEGDHYGLNDVKDRIVEYLAVRKLKKDSKGSILCLVGPPGVGKTSLGKSVARALGRKYARMSLGGLHDEAEIRGHRKTYIGAMPGRVVQNIRRAGSSNPVFILDEIDKVGQDFRGDPSSALLEVLDPEQNTHFYDNFLELEYDLSKVLFIATANTLSTVSPALRDRMELIEITGYLVEEKREIAVKHLIPKQLEAHGVTAEQFTLDREVIEEVIQKYTRESGVRELDKRIAKLVRFRAREIAFGNSPSPEVTSSGLAEILGPPR